MTSETPPSYGALNSSRFSLPPQLADRLYEAGNFLGIVTGIIAPPVIGIITHDPLATVAGWFTWYHCARGSRAITDTPLGTSWFCAAGSVVASGTVGAVGVAVVRTAGLLSKCVHG